jgi:hypothetical protein
MRGFPQNKRDQLSSLPVHRHGLAEILRPDKKFLFITVVRVRTGQPFLDFVPNPLGIDACGFAIFVGDTEFGAIPAPERAFAGILNLPFGSIFTDVLISQLLRPSQFLGLKPRFLLRLGSRTRSVLPLIVAALFLLKADHSTSPPRS